MKVTTQQAIRAKKAIESVAELKMPAKVSYRLGRWLNQMAPLTDQFEKTRNKLVIEKYGRLVEGSTEKYEVDPAKLTEYLTEISSILIEGEELDIQTLSVEAFESIEVPYSFFNSLEGFIID